MIYISKRKPRAHQAEAAKKITGMRGFAVLAGMRTGKTKIIVDDWGRMVTTGEAIDMVVIAPGGAYLPWREAIEADLPAELLKSTFIFTWVASTSRGKTVSTQRDAFLAYRGPRVLLINAEAISSMLPARQFVWDFCRQRSERCAVVVDESVIIKNKDSKVGRFCAEALGMKANVGWRRIMSGLVSPRAPSDIWNQFRFLDPRILGYEDFTVFQARYEAIERICVIPQPLIRAKFDALFGNIRTMTPEQRRYKARLINPDLDMRMPQWRLDEWLRAMVEGMKRDQMIELIQRLGGYVQTVPKLKEFLNIEELRDKIAPWSHRVHLADCYDMPESDYSFRDVEMTRQQAQLYREVKANACAQLESLDHVSASHVVVQMLRLHQIVCGHVMDENGKIHDIPEKRTAALIDLLQDYEGKAVIWASYDHSIAKITKALKTEFGADSVARFWGGNVAVREEEERRFKIDPKCWIMLATPDAGGRGRDWAVADLCIYYSSRNNLDHRSQSEERIKAVGKSRSCIYVDLRTPGTVEERIIEALRDKQDMARIINGDEWRKWLI